MDRECRGYMSYICCCVPCIFDFYNCYCVDEYSCDNREYNRKKCMSGFEISNIMKDACTIWFDCCCESCYWKLNDASMIKMHGILQDNYKDVFRVSLTTNNIIIIQPL